ncbi:hypothetical protein SD81_040250 [Tolypothrix campylonemoides VB511288]|nr:hypothetical protein SD81_040250 [Tolypothrix campylonemoides VB511288]
MKSNLRFNYNVPKSMVNDLKRIAQQKGMEPSWYLRKIIEKAIEEENKQASLPSINFSKFESFSNQ